MPEDFTPGWLLFYGKLINTSMILSNLMPYLAPILTIIYRRGCCCCRRKNYKPNTPNNEEFPIERRYASILATVFTCFTYGVAIPMLFISASLVMLT